MRHWLHSIALAFIHGALLIGYMHADYNYNPFSNWNQAYYIGAKLAGLLICLCAAFPLNYYKWQWLIVAIFLFIRLLWQVYNVADEASAGRPSIIFSLFCINCVCILIQFIIQWAKK